MKKKICVVTGARAEYGLLKPLLDALIKDNSFIVQIIATGMHLSREFGLTYRDIENDGFIIHAKVKMLSGLDTSMGIAQSMGKGIIGFAHAYEQRKPDMIVLLGDRFEILAAAVAATVYRIPLAHIHGGELTEGAFDDAFRHAITKMSQLHFTSTETYRKRVIQLGEQPSRVFNVGALGMDAITNCSFFSRASLEKKLGFTFKKKNLLITFHPVTLDARASTKQCHTLLTVLDTLKDTQLIFTGANADPEGRAINTMIKTYVSQHTEKAIFCMSLGQRRYFSFMKYVDAVVGNSSSGIIEAPSFHIGTINIGDRQKGRIQADNVINCEPSVQGIARALKTLYSSNFQKKLKNIKNPYGDGNTAKKIKEIVKNVDMHTLLKKSFYDLRKHIA